MMAVLVEYREVPPTAAGSRCDRYGRWWARLVCSSDRALPSRHITIDNPNAKILDRCLGVGGERCRVPQLFDERVGFYLRLAMEDG